MADIWLPEQEVKSKYENQFWNIFSRELYMVSTSSCMRFPGGFYAIGGKDIVIEPQELEKEVLNVCLEKIGKPREHALILGKAEDEPVIIQSVEKKDILVNFNYIVGLVRCIPNLEIKEEDKRILEILKQSVPYLVEFKFACLISSPSNTPPMLKQYFRPESWRRYDVAVRGALEDSLSYLRKVKPLCTNRSCLIWP